MARYSRYGHYNRYDPYDRGAAGAIDVTLTMADLLPLPKPSAINRAEHDEVMPRYDGDRMWGGRTLAQTEHDAATYQPTDAMRRLRERMEDDLPTFTTRTRRRTRVRQMDGDAIDAVALLEWRRNPAEDARIWDRTERQERKHTGTVSIACNFGLTGGEPTTNLEWSGAAALAMTDLLETLGYRVELFGIITSQDHPNGRSYNVVVELKGAEDRLTESAIALISDGSIRRRVWWSYLDSRPERVVVGGWGYPTDYIGQQTFDVTVSKHITTEDQAATFVADTVDRLRKRGEGEGEE